MSHDERDVETAAEAIFDVVVDHPMWLGDDGEPLDYNPDREARICDFAGDAARAVLDALDLPARDRRVAREAQAAILRFFADEHVRHQTPARMAEDLHELAAVLDDPEGADDE